MKDGGRRKANKENNQRTSSNDPSKERKGRDEQFRGRANHLSAVVALARCVPQHGQRRHLVLSGDWKSWNIRFRNITG